jgi:hypothetical protein
VNIESRFVFHMRSLTGISFRVGRQAASPFRLTCQQ